MEIGQKLKSLYLITTKQPNLKLKINPSKLKGSFPNAFIFPNKAMGQAILIIVNNCLNTNIYSYLETSGVQSSNLYLNVVHFFNSRVNWTSVAA